MTFLRIIATALFFSILSVAHATEIEIRIVSNISTQVNSEVITPRGFIHYSQAAEGQVVTVPIPDHVRIQGISLHNSTIYFAVDSSFSAGGVSYRPTDIIKLEGGALSVWLSAHDIGLEIEARFSDISVTSSGVAISIDRTVQTGIGVITPRDIVYWDGDSLSKLFSGASSGVPETVALSGFSFCDDNQLLYLTFSNSASLQDTLPVDNSIFRFDIDKAKWLSPLSADALIGGCSTCRINALDVQRDPSYIFKDRFEEI